MTEVTIKNYGQITIASGGGSSVDLVEVEQRLKNLVIRNTPPTMTLEEIVASYNGRSWEQTVETKHITCNPWLSDFSGVTDIVSGVSIPGVWYINNGSGTTSFVEGITIPVIYSSGKEWYFVLPDHVIDTETYTYKIWEPGIEISMDNINN